MENIYTPEGWLDVPKIVEKPYPFIFCTGARGVGKTYGALKYVIENGIPFIYLRRTLTETEFLAANESNNPFARLNMDTGENVGLMKSGKYTTEIVRRVPDGDKLVPDGHPVGMMLALSTISNLRGFNGEQYEIIVYDEFIPEPHARPIREECMALMNAYETINRNRELLGKPPVKLLCLSNSNRLDNAIYMGLGLVNKVVQMQRKHQQLSYMPDRGIMLVNIMDSPISAAKSKTALYRMTAGTEFGAMALDNKYIGEDLAMPNKSEDLRNYDPLVNIGELCIYRRKGGENLYITTHVSGGPARFGLSDAELTNFRRKYNWIWAKYITGKIIFEERLCEILLNRYFGA